MSRLFLLLDGKGQILSCEASDNKKGHDCFAREIGKVEGISKTTIN